MWFFMNGMCVQTGWILVGRFVARGADGYRSASLTRRARMSNWGGNPKWARAILRRDDVCERWVGSAFFPR